MGLSDDIRRKAEEESRRAQLRECAGDELLLLSLKIKCTHKVQRTNADGVTYVETHISGTNTGSAILERVEIRVEGRDWPNGMIVVPCEADGTPMPEDQV